MEGIKALENKKDIIIRPADKGGGVVVMDKTYYHSQLQDMLQNENTYQLLSRDPTEKYRENLFNLVDYGFYMRAITKKEKSYLCPSFNRIPTIYTVPKIHKNPERPPARPIVNGINSVTSLVGEYLDHFLQTSVTDTKAYLKDTTSFIRKIRNVSFSENAEIYLITADVASLYTIIQHDDALLSLNWAFSKREDIPFIQKKILRMILDYCLTHNYFWYLGNFYNQKTGVAMGAKFSPSLANLFMNGRTSGSIRKGKRNWFSTSDI